MPEANVGTRDAGILEHCHVHRLRPDPWDPTAVHSVTAGVGADTFGDYVLLIPIGAYDFGDNPNKIHVYHIGIESFSANDVYILEFSKSPNGIDFTVIGAIRIKRAAALIKTMFVDHATRPLNNDTERLYVRMKSGNGSNTITFCLLMARHKETAYVVPDSGNVFPTG